MSIQAQPFITMRRENWTIRWAEFIKDSLDLATELTLDYESISCTSFCGDGIEAITGENPFDPFRDTFQNELGAVRVIKEAGFTSLDDLIQAIFSVEVPLAFAHPGDLLLCKRTFTEEMKEADPLRIVMPHGLALADPPHYWAVTEKGLSKGNIYVDALRCFAVGREIRR